MKSTISFFLTAALLLGHQVFADKCDSGALRGNNYRYIDLKKADLDDDLKAAIKNTRKQVEKNLGWCPEIRRLLLADTTNVVRLFEKGEGSTNKDNAIAMFSYRIKGTRLSVGYTETKKKYRRNGLSELMLAEILAENPEIDEIYVKGLVETNGDLFDEANETKGIKESIRETAIYKACEHFGFSKIVDAKNVELQTKPMDFGDGKAYQLLLNEDEAGVSFTVKRPKK